MQAWPKQYKTRLNALPLVHANNFHVIPCSKVLGVIARVLIHLLLAPTHAPDKDKHSTRTLIHLQLTLMPLRRSCKEEFEQSNNFFHDQISHACHQYTRTYRTYKSYIQIFSNQDLQRLQKLHSGIQQPRSPQNVTKAMCLLHKAILFEHQVPS